MLMNKLSDYFYGLDGDSKERYMLKLSLFKDKTPRPEDYPNLEVFIFPDFR